MTPTTSPPLTQDELRRAFNAARRPDDPDLAVLAQHAARYELILGTALRTRRRSLSAPAPDSHIPAPAHWPPHVARLHPAHAASSSTSSGNTATVTPLRRRTDAATAIDFKSLAAGDRRED